LGVDAAVTYLTSRDPKDASAAGSHTLKALATAPDLAQSHLARGLYHRSVTLHVDSALAYLERARELAPGDAEVAHFLASAYQVAGLFEQALTESRRGAALDPKNPSALGRVARTLAWLRRPVEAWDSHADVRVLAPATVPPFSWADGPIIRLAQGDLTAARAAIATIPSAERRRVIVYVFTPFLLPQVVDDSLLADTCDRGERSWFAAVPWSRHLVCAEAATRARQTARARAHADSAARLVRAAIARNPTDYSPGPQYAWALLAAGDTAEALRQADAALEWRRINQDAFFGALNALWYAQIVALAGDSSRAMRALDELLTKPSPVTVAWLRADPTFDRLRGDARFAALLAKAEGR
jgi:tetratricopeptide (TPR) repeat protein